MTASRIGVAAALLIVVSFAAFAQELEPRLYGNAPVGLNALLVSYGLSRGNVLVDTSLPIEDARADVNFVGLVYVRTLDLFDRSGKLEVLLPYSWGEFEGRIDGELRRRSPAGFADPRFRLAVNLVGSPALRGRDFVQYRQRTIVGASLQVVAPLGQYDRTKLVNLGSNRWSFRPEVGLSRAVGSWTFELAGSAWLFTDNDDFFGGAVLDQDPIFAIKGHAIYSFRPGLWLAVNFGAAGGGKTTVDGQLRNDLQKNTRIGATFSLPMARRQALKVVYTSGLTTRIGADFDSIVLAYQYTWMDGS